MILKQKKYFVGYSLIELVIFIVIVSAVASTILIAMQTVLKKSHSVQEHGVAIQAAAKCLEWYQGQAAINGYASIACPSTAVPSFCSVPTGFSLTTNVACSTLYGESSANYKTIQVSVTGKGSGTLSLILADDS